MFSHTGFGTGSTGDSTAHTTRKAPTPTAIQAMGTRTGWTHRLYASARPSPASAATATSPYMPK